MNIFPSSLLIRLIFVAASVDYETDRNIQDTIAREFHDRTILCIARKFLTICSEMRSSSVRNTDRLRTIIGYDRVCVLDAGIIVEFDTPSALYLQKDGIFRGMCDQSSISWDDIRYAAKAHEQDG